MDPSVGLLNFDGLMLQPFKHLSLMEFVGTQRGDLASHDAYQVVFVLCGTFYFDKPTGERMLLKPGDAGIVPPLMPHIWGTAADGRCELLEAMYQPFPVDRYADVARVCNEQENADWRQVSLGLDLLRPVAARIRHECEHLQVAGGGVLYGLMMTLLSYVARRLDREEDRLMEDPVHYPIRAALRYVESHYRERISIPELAAQAHLGVSRFSQLFRDVTGMAPGHYLDHYRLKKAETLLLYSPLRVREIADYLGYTSEYYFSRAFKKHAGRPPKEFRLQKR